MTVAFLISACLCGQPCRYDGASAGRPEFTRLVLAGEALAVCPEMLGGLGVPRPPCELWQGKVLTRSGEDCTAAFIHGAALSLELALRHNIPAAILKDKSPSCGCRRIYDGTFNKRLIPGMGLTAALLAENGLALHSEEEALKLLL